MGPEITKECDFCGGTGEKSPGVNCPKCDGACTIPVGSFSIQDITDGQDGILDKCDDILDKLDE